MATIRQYQHALFSLFRGMNISDGDGNSVMKCIKHNRVCTGSDGPVKDGKGGHVFSITDNAFTKAIWGYAPAVGSLREISSLRAERGGVLGILLLLDALYIYYQEYFPSELTILK